MSTHCRIGLVNDDGKVESIFCHYDGYPAGVSRHLKDNYSTKELVQELLSKGDLDHFENGLPVIEEEGKSIVSENFSSFMALSSRSGCFAYYFANDAWHYYEFCKGHTAQELQW